MPTIRSSRVVLGDEVRPASIRFEKGVVVEIGDRPADLNLGDLVVLPGLVDSHVHVNEPGRTQWEGFATATLAAAAGGSTTIVDMPLNSIPPTVDTAALDAKRAAASGKLSVDVAFWGGLVPGWRSRLRSLVESGVCGVKAFLVDSGVEEFPPLTAQDLEGALEELASMRVPALVHAEDAGELVPVPDGTRRYREYLESRPVAAEAVAVSRLADAAARTGAGVHVLHVSSAEAVELIGRGSRLTGETCPHYLTFAAEEIPDGATEFKCAPPIRGAEHREALWEGLRRGDLAMVVSDHSPAPAVLKHLDDGDFSRAWGGISSLQLRLPATWTEAARRGIGLVELARLLGGEPARLAGLGDRKGELAVGKDADLVVFDPDGAIEVRGADLLHRHSVTPYEGMRLRGRVRSTYLGGIEVFDGSRVVSGHGRMLAR